MQKIAAYQNKQEFDPSAGLTSPNSTQSNKIIVPTLRATIENLSNPALPWKNE